jgi:hypothetical protein
VAELLFKFTAPGRRPTHAGNGFVWPAPSGKRPGKWTDPVPSVVPCESGYHLTTAAHLLDWAHAELWVAEGRGKRVDADNKVAFESARLVRRVDAWNERTAREFACWCTEQALPFADEVTRAVCVDTIAVARAYAAGSATRDQLDAAWAAAWAAAGDAAGAAAWAAAGDAAGAAARAAARAAAWAAAGAAAWAAARAAAGDAARDAAWAAAGAAAWAAAWDAARDAQTAHLLDMLGLTDA